MKLLFVLLLVVTAGCSATPMRSAESANSGVTASLVTVIEGRYRLYRVDVGNRSVYFVTEGGRSIDTVSQWLKCTPCGKTTCCHEEIDEVLAVRR